MSRARVTWAANELLTSIKHNQEISDYLRRGQLIISSCGSVLQTQTGVQDAGGFQTGQLVLIRNGFTLGWYPYNPDKQIFDRLAIHGAFGAIDVNDVDRTSDMHLQYSLDSGTSWITAGLTETPTPTFPTLPPQSMAVALDGGATTVNISGMTTLQWIGLRFTFDVTCTAATWMAFAFLYLDADTPF